MAGTSGHIQATPPVAVPSAGQAPTNYILGPDDQVTLFVADLDEISGKPMRIDMRGDLNIPLAGRIHVAGLTADQFEAAVEDGLKKALRDPHVVVNVTEFRSQPVSILGEVGQPGVHQLEGRKTLVEMLSLAGGLRPDSGNTITIVRDAKWGRIPLPNAHDDHTSQFSVASVSVKSIMNGSNPDENILIKPQDTITVPKANMIYVIGSVKRPGGFILSQDESITALQLLSLAEGLDKTAAGAKARVMRTLPGNPNRTEIAINLNKLLSGKIPDVPLKSDDILVIPSSAAKTVLARSAEAAVTVGSGLALYAAH